MSETETYLAELEAAEAEAAGLWERAGPDGGDLNESARALIRRMRGVLKQYGHKVETMRTELRTEARHELIRERQTEAGFRRLSVPPSARALFGDVDPTDEAAMAARSDELREAGVTWPGQPAPEPPKVDPTLAAQRAMQMAAAGGGTPGSAGDLKARMLDMQANPGKYSDNQIAAVVDEYNAAVRAAEKPSSGALG